MRKTIIAAACAVTLAVAGCGSDDSDSDSTITSTVITPAAETTTANADSPAAVTALTIEGGRLVSGPDTISASLGGTVVFEVTTDEADELHIHGYDKTVDLPAGTPERVEFTADIPGVFEIELHHAGTEIAQLRVGE